MIDYSKLVQICLNRLRFLFIQLMIITHIVSYHKDQLDIDNRSTIGYIKTAIFFILVIFTIFGQ